jgi:hypothetical protein
MNMSEVKGMNMLEEHERPSNHRPEEEDMDMDMVEERPSNERQEVECMNMEGMNMVEHMTTKVDVKVVEREHECVMLMKHWINDRAERHQRTHQE